MIDVTVDDLRDTAIDAVRATAIAKGDRAIAVTCLVASQPLREQSGPFVRGLRDRARRQVVELIRDNYLGIPEHIGEPPCR